jgi:hypothetical protein
MIEARCWRCSGSRRGREALVSASKQKSVGGKLGAFGGIRPKDLARRVNMALGTTPITECPDIDPNGDHSVAVAELVAAVNNALGGCEAQANRAPEASNVSFAADALMPYVERQLIGHDPDNDTITYELIAEDSGEGYSFAYVNPESGTLYLTLADEFQGTISLSYRVTDGKLFSNDAHVSIQVPPRILSRNGGVQPVDPREYASHPRGFYNGNLRAGPDRIRRCRLRSTSARISRCLAIRGAVQLCGLGARVCAEELPGARRARLVLEPASHRFSPAYIYNQLNGGQNIVLIYNDALDLVANQGVATLATMPYDDQDFLTQPSLAARQEAAQFKVLSWDTANGTLEIKEALANHLAVFFVLHQFEDMSYLHGPDSCTTRSSGLERPTCGRGGWLRRQPLRRSVPRHQFLGTGLGRRRILLVAVLGGNPDRLHGERAQFGIDWSSCPARRGRSEPTG